MQYHNRKKVETYEVVVCGGGLAGLCAAVSAARQGAKTCIIQDRPVFGGNSSSEIRIKPLGADRYHVYGRETGIISELLNKERAINHSESSFCDVNSKWDIILYDLAVTTPNLSFHLNTKIIKINRNSEDRIESVVGNVANSETEITFKGRIFVDCTGDGVVGAMAGCEWRMGEEARSEFKEPHAPKEASEDTMGSSLHFTSKDMGRSVPFTPPEWAVEYDDPDFFYETNRNLYTQKGGYWWIEISKPFNTIYDNERIRHELTRHVLGIWDWIKNKDPNFKEKAKNWALDWVGQVPGKRESRRLMGEYLVTEHDIVDNPHFEDEVGFGGFYVDLHAIGGLLNEKFHEESTSAEGPSYIPPYGFPLRMLISKDIENLMMAGRNVSVTHVALGTLRVMSTTSLMGQAAGVAAAVSVEKDIPVKEIPETEIKKVQQTLLKEGCFLPHEQNKDEKDIARTAEARAGSSSKVRGIGPNDHNWLNNNFEFLDTQEVRLEQRLAQWIAISENNLEKLSVCLTNHTDKIQKVKATLMPVEHIWDYNDNPKATPIAETILEVNPGKLQWVDWDIKLKEEEQLTPLKYVRLDLHQNENVSWQTAGTILPGHMCAYEMEPGRLKKYKEGRTMSFKIKPEQSVFNPENVLSGVTRPHQFTNLWRSDPQKPLPEWFELKWEEPKTINEIQITFAGNLLFEYGNYPPLYRDGYVAKDYNICAYREGKWETIAEIQDNYRCRCKHSLDTEVTTDKIRINIFNTNGDLSAGIYEVRCY